MQLKRHFIEPKTLETRLLYVWCFFEVCVGFNSEEADLQVILTRRGLILLQLRLAVDPTKTAYTGRRRPVYAVRVYEAIKSFYFDPLRLTVL